MKAPPPIGGARFNPDRVMVRTENVVFGACRLLWREHLQYPLDW